MKGGGTREALGRDGLDDVPLIDVEFEVTNMFFVSCLADVGDILLVRDDRRLMRQR